MSVRRPRTPRVLRPLVLVALATLLLTAAGATPATAAPKTLHGAAYDIMKSFMGQWDKDGFARVTDLGGSKLYRVRLAQCKIVVDPDLRDDDGGTPNARYGPEPNVITFSKDPRKLKGGDRTAWGETVWHEVTHALEATNGDDMTAEDKLFQERHTEYMASVSKEALPWLAQLESKARAGASVTELRGLWQKYLEKMDYAAKKLPETQKFPPDADLMKQWFGFTVDTVAIQKMYLTDKAFSGDQWKNLREALKPAGDWAGTWHTSQTWTDHVEITVSGDKATLALYFEATINDVKVLNHFDYDCVVDGGMLTGRRTWTDSNGHQWESSFEIVLSADEQTFTGRMQNDDLDDPGDPSVGRWLGWRPGHDPIQ